MAWHPGTCALRAVVLAAVAGEVVGRRLLPRWRTRLPLRVAEKLRPPALSRLQRLAPPEVARSMSEVLLFSLLGASVLWVEARR